MSRADVATNGDGRCRRSSRRPCQRARRTRRKTMPRRRRARSRTAARPAGADGFRQAARWWWPPSTPRTAPHGPPGQRPGPGRDSPPTTARTHHGRQHPPTRPRRSRATGRPMGARGGENPSPAAPPARSVRRSRARRRERRHVLVRGGRRSAHQRHRRSQHPEDGEKPSRQSFRRRRGQLLARSCPFLSLRGGDRLGSLVPGASWARRPSSS